jgi:hypothetical protein
MVDITTAWTDITSQDLKWRLANTSNRISKISINNMKNTQHLKRLIATKKMMNAAIIKKISKKRDNLSKRKAKI